MQEGQDALLIDVGNNTERNNLDTASGGLPLPVGFIGFPQAPLLPNPASNLIVSNLFYYVAILYLHFLFKLHLSEF